MIGAAVRGLFIAATLALTCGASNAAPLSLDFAGSALQRLRSGNAGSDRFVEYGRNNDGVAERLTVRAISDPAPFEAQVGKLVKSIKADNPKAKLHILQRPNAKDVIISYLADRANSNVSLMLWRVSATDAKIVAAIYRMDFDIEDEDAKERVVKHTAERALAAYDSAKFLDLVSNTD
ncbi:hypothetical protein [Bradyrhizobium sp. AUGA SZCCT0431]|uniref:hypothetical protein n=1 Tax=Bradyrhizobium sp. AUGA SZCCT0431 TaxID=2807674 RepID=UPI001BA4ADF6|nr:hypothetical protein [Bradyrhizobium sp. AUGA SZCCT0431]MBR1143900.1 hypothetical protein [Bradyrhizobium sp. AUGA SZCCT0431]